ncbi:MAG TPA: M23 family metallopeptidase [Beutenbergiaceae bacterium]|nr:M23 family metallopeptidase [Beutenbergiaceae bacterium]
MKKCVIAAYRCRVYLLFGAFAVLILVAATRGYLPAVERIAPAFSLAVLAVVGGCLLLTVVGPRLLDPLASRVVAPPVSGEWSAVNSPASKVPSHGTRFYGQAYAIDLVAEGPGDRPTFGSGPAMRRPEDYPAFGAPVYSMVSGTAVAVVDRRRDHRARSNWLSVLYMLLEGMVREVAGMSFLLGNHVTIDHGDGTFGLLAHLKRGSVKVKVGSEVKAGDLIAECGNSGNSSEPHVHAQLMDRASPRTAQGVPMSFTGILDAAGSPIELPTNGQTMISVSAEQGSREGRGS